MTCERVYAVWGYFDGVRSGFADYHGAPHYFEALWNEVEDDYEPRFRLIPVSSDTIALVVEQWEIFSAWEHRFYSGEVSGSTHPGAPGQNSRYVEIERMILYVIRHSPALCELRGIFRSRSDEEFRPKGSLRDLEVEWLEP